jgi:hypothetical protein
MNKDGEIYRLTEDEAGRLTVSISGEYFADLTSSEKERIVEIREDVARLDGYRLGQGRGRSLGRGSNSDLAG